MRCAWYDDARAAAARAGRLPLPRRRPRLVPARRLPLLRGHAGRAARGPGGHGGLPAGARAPLSRRARGLPGRLPRARVGARPTRHTVVVSGDSCGGLLGLGTLLAARDEGLAAAGVLRLDLGLVRPLGGRRLRATGRDPFLTAEWVRNRGTGVRRRAGGARRPAGLARPTPTWRACRPSTCPWGSTTRCATGAVRWRMRAMRAGVDVTLGVVAGHGARLAGPGQRRGARGAGVVRPGRGSTSPECSATSRPAS